MIVELTVTFSVLLALTGLAIDGGRLIWFHFELSSAASNAVAAGGKQLDGKNGAIDRAKEATREVANANLRTLDGFSTAEITDVRVCTSLAMAPTP